MKKILAVIIPAVSLFTFAQAINDAAVSDLAKQIQTKSAKEIYQVITSLQTKVFSTEKSYLEAGLEDFDKWENLLAACQKYFNNPSGLKDAYKNNLEESKKHLEKLEEFGKWLHLSIEDLRNGKSKGVGIKRQIQNKLTHINTVIRFAMENIINDPTSETSIDIWESSLQGKTSKKIFPKINEFLKDYLKNKNEIAQVRVINKYEPKGAYQIENILEKLYQVVYVEKKRSKSSLLGKAKKVLALIRSNYPTEISPYFNAKFTDSQDKLSVIIRGLADALRGALKHFLRDVA